MLLAGGSLTAAGFFEQRRQPSGCLLTLKTLYVKMVIEQSPSESSFGLPN